MSLARIGLIWASAAFYIYGHPIVGLSLGYAAGVSDYLDGYLARKLDQVTELGATLDRLCDLIMETTAFVVSVHYHVFSPLFFVAYLVRELVVMSARMYCAGRNYPVPPSFLGKLKTNFLGYSFIVIYLGIADVIPITGARRFLEGLGTFGIGMALVWSYLSGYTYLRAFAHAYNSDPERGA